MNHTKGNQASTGRTTADVLAMVFEWRNAALIWLLVTALAATLFGLYALATVVIPRWSHAARTDVKIGAFETSVLFESVEDNKRGFVTIVHPQGWQDTDIAVSKNDRISLTAGGRIQIDVNGPVKQAQLRILLENTVRAREKLDPDSSAPRNIPEDWFTPEELAELRDPRQFRPWFGPQGYDASIQAWKARTARRIMPDQPIGKLIGAIRSNGVLSAPFPIGERAMNIVAPQAGTLWLTVNDVQFNVIPELFYSDNAGFFWVKVEVSGHSRF